MFTPIHRALGLEPTDLDWSLIEQVVEQHVREETDLDWKQVIYSSRNRKWRDEFAKDVAAMANSGGGWIVFGVADDGDDRAACIEGVEWSSGERQRLLTAAYNAVSPPLTGLRFHPVSDEGNRRTVVLMEVPDSDERPHFARRQDGAFTAPRRNGPHTEYMSDREIERGFRDRFRSRQDREAEFEVLFEEASAIIGADEAVGLVVIARPVRAPGLPVQLDREAAWSLLSGPIDDELFAKDSLSRERQRWEYGDIRVCYRGWSSRDRAGSRLFKRVEESGALTFAYRLGLLTTDPSYSAFYPVGDPFDCRTIDLEAAMGDAMARIRRAAQRSMINSPYEVRAGLVASRGEPIRIRKYDTWIDSLGDRHEDAIPIVHFRPVAATIDPVAELSAFIGDVASIALDLLNQGGIEYLSVLKN